MKKVKESEKPVIRYYFADLEKAKIEAKKAADNLRVNIYIRKYIYGCNLNKVEYKLCTLDEFIFPPSTSPNVVHIETYKPKTEKP